MIEKTSAFEKQKKVVFGEISRIPDQGYVASPKYTSIKQIKEEKWVEGRKKAGLTDHFEVPKAAAGEPGLTYVRNPVPNCYSKLVE